MIRHLLPRRIVFLVVALTVGSHLRTTLAAEQSTDFFEQKIRPLLVERCQACHSSGEEVSNHGAGAGVGWNAGEGPGVGWRDPRASDTS